MLDKLGGDEVRGYYVPGFAGKQFARRSIEAAQNLLRVTGYADLGGPWVPVGVGINTGIAYYGAVQFSGWLSRVNGTRGCGQCGRPAGFKGRRRGNCDQCEYSPKGRLGYLRPGKSNP